ncbi:DNA-3-methyladenine glycosylase 1 [Methylacidimicrobium cyclopophantes]|uniref:DNA-3-methyladenine glycosylase 1 n=1 Tax=Methylacidimicrobium cyclopophantes TaxID=1041766 RepID=A0A5E6MJR7_9BACT|nr:DNA-3-methyladenine glycosylase 1 [Methylacidimicrobium cyclopophantes]
MPLYSILPKRGLAEENKSRYGKRIVSPKLVRCPWAEGDPLLADYHDREWGVPEFDPRSLYEKLVLDAFQAGLSWLLILRKRTALREAFAGFHPERVARYGRREIERLLGNPAIVRSRAKIESAIRSARLWIEIMEREPGGFTRFVWKHVGETPQIHRYQTPEEVPAQSELSGRMSKEFRKRGFSFCGPVILYAFAQGIGMVNDHLVGCHRHAACGIGRLPERRSGSFPNRRPIG